MKKSKLSELRMKTTKELEELIKKTQGELVKLRLAKEAGKLKDVHQVSKKRHDLARLKTILREKELNENF